MFCYLTCTSITATFNFKMTETYLCGDGTGIAITCILNSVKRSRTTGIRIKSSNCISYCRINLLRLL